MERDPHEQEHLETIKISLAKGQNNVLEGKAFRHLYNRYTPVFASLLGPRCHYDQELIADCLQEGWSEVLASLKRYDVSRSFFSWAAIIFLRTVRREKRKLGKVGKEFEISPERWQFLADSAELDTDSEQKEMLASLQRALDRLAREDYTVLFLRYFEKKKIQDIEMLMGLSRSAVFYRIERAQKKLKKLMEQEWGKDSL